MSHEGFFCAYFTGHAGNGLALFALKDGLVVGIDADGVKLDGRYRINEQNNEYVGTVSIDAPPGVTLIQGISTGPSGLKYDLPFCLPRDFAEHAFVRINTPFGPLNAKFVKLRDWT